MSAASARVCLQTPFPPCSSRSRTLRRPLHSPGLAGGFRQAVKFYYVVALVVNFALPFPDSWLSASSGYATPTSTLVMAQLMDVSWRCAPR